MKKFMVLLLTVLMVLSLAACGNDNSGDPGTPDAGGTDEFRSAVLFCGSTSLYPIISSLASSFTDEHVTWDKVDASFPASNISIFVAPGGSGVGVSSVLDGTSNYGMLARDIRESEIEAMGADYHEYIVAKDALTVSVNAENPITDLTDDMDRETIRQIFAGEITTWDQVDDSLPAETIQVFIRDLSGGAYEVFQNTVMGDSEVTAAATQSASMTELATNIAGNKWAIGYAGFGAYNKANADSQVLFAMKVDGVECNEANIVSGEYTIQRPVLFVSNAAPTAAEQSFIDYIFSAKGADVIVSNGYIPAF